MNRRSFLTLTTTGLCAGLYSNSFAAMPKPKAQIGRYGLDLTGRDLKIKPGDDFFNYGGGNWMKINKIPSDRTRWGVFDQLRAKSETDVRAIIEELSKKTYATGTIEQKIGDFYATFLDEATINSKGLAPLKPELDLIANAKTHEDIAAVMGKPDMPTQGPIGWGLGLDDGNPDRYIITITHSGLGLPEREFYLKDDERMREIRSKYPLHIAKTFELAGILGGTEKAKAIMALETEIAKLHWPVEQRRESTKMYNLTKRADLEAFAPDFPWASALGASGYNEIKECVIGEKSAMPELAKLFRATPVSVWQDYLTYHLIKDTSALLPKPIDDERFDFYGKILNGQKEQRARWKRATVAIDGALGEAIGQIYVKKHFSQSAKAKMLVLVENLRKGFKSRIEKITWMSPATKMVAYKKLASFNPKIGYPDKWKDYSSLDIIKGDALGNSRRVMAFQHKYDLDRLYKPTDKTEWFMTPQTVNAYYNPVFNEIVFPAAILQPPFFDENADDAVNYGAIGGVIGHEMGHGFDDQGAQYDDKGVLREWWNEADTKAFKLLGDKMVKQYSGFTPLPGVKLNGQLSLGENIGDHCGIVVGYEAYKLSLKGKPAPVLEGYTGDQRFFLAWAQVWRSLYTPEALRNQVQSGPHSPAEYRVNGTLQNVDAWYRAFNVTPNNKLYVAPNKRVRIW